MPVFHDPRDSLSKIPYSEQASSYESQGAGFLTDGFRPPAPLTGTSLFENALEPESCPNFDHTLCTHGRSSSPFNRAELIERIKRENSPSWQQSRSVSPRLALADEISYGHPKWKLSVSSDKLAQSGSRLTASAEARSKPQDRPREPSRSPPAPPDFFRNHASAGLEIERPRSALHHGDFREKDEDDQFDTISPPSGTTLATSPVAPWHRSFPAAAFPHNRSGSPFPEQELAGSDSPTTNRARPRAVTHLACSSPFVFMPPTSPLVQQSNNTDLDFSSRAGSRQGSRSPDRGSRRHTFSPRSFEPFQSAHMARSPNRDGQPYQAHQPRRSVTSFNQSQPHSTPQTPFMQPRRPSISDVSPLHHAPMVGSYEESILRGRMSTTPSRPLNFVARIGVLGRGKCKESLRCPSHVTVPFPAVFYSYSGGKHNVADDSPSPYVGLIDLENSLAPSEDNSHSRRKRRHTVPYPLPDGADISPGNNDNGNVHEAPTPNEKIRPRERGKRRSISPRAPPGGSYRIPQQGQVQIVIKNPNQTAVKLFLVPYDLTGMEPGQKTFVRQRSYSAGPIIDMPMSSRKNLGTDRPEAALSNSDDPRDRPILRYLVHLHICCPSKGRFYLYKSIRVVFANRVPDGKETLRNETQLPDPPYSAYKPSRDTLTSWSSSSGTAQLTAEIAARRTSFGHVLSQQLPYRLDGFSQRPPPPPPAVQFTGGNGDPFGASISTGALAEPFSLPGESHQHVQHASRLSSNMALASPFTYSADSSSIQTELAGRTLDSPFTKLSRGEAGYGGSAFSGIGISREGLLARKLRGLPLEDDEEDS